MAETAITVFTFFGLSFLAGFLYPVFYAIIGAPEQVLHPVAGQFNDRAKIHALKMPGMIFRRYGAWLCRGQDEHNRLHDKSLLHIVFMPLALLESHGIETSYNRARGEVVILSIGQVGTDWAVTLRLLPGETAAIDYQDRDGKAKRAFSEPAFPNFDPAKMPLSIYKALGLCGICTAFWLTLAVLLPACFVLHLFPASYFWLFVPAYGVSTFGANAYEL